MTYANSESVKTRLGQQLTDTQNGSVSDTLITETITTADNTINSELIDAAVTIPTSAPTDQKELQVYNLLISAGTLLAVADILDSLYNTVQGERSPTARGYETKANNLIQKYIDYKRNATSSPSPYSVGLSPGGHDLHDFLHHDHR